MKEQSLKEQIAEIKDKFKENSQLSKQELKENFNSDKLDDALKNLIKDIRSGKNIDDRAIDTLSDGEILATFLRPIFQSALIQLRDRKGFTKNFIPYI